MVSSMSAIAIASCSLPSVSRAIAARIQSRSAPAQNDGPAPARTTARSCVGPSRASSAKAVRSSAMRVASNALWTSGRSSVTRATTPSGSRPLDPQAAVRHGTHRGIVRHAAMIHGSLVDPPFVGLGSVGGLC